MFIFSSFQVPGLFFPTISVVSFRFVTNSYMRRQRALKDKQIQTVFSEAELKTEAESCITLYKAEHPPLATYSIYFYNVLRVCSCDVFKFYLYMCYNKADNSGERNRIMFWFFFYCSPHPLLRLATRLQMIDGVHSLVFSFGPSGNPLAVRCHSCVNQGERHVPASESLSFLCGVCDFTELAYFTRCLQRCTLWLGVGGVQKLVNKKKKMHINIYIYLYILYKF